MNKDTPYNIKDLPYVTAQIAGIGGELKKIPETFIVEELLSYEASGEGQHIYATIERENLNTQDVIVLLKRAFKIPEKEIGKAGLKDKNARTIQTFSLSLGANYCIQQAEEIINGIECLKLLKLTRHTNKIKTGHLKGNRFEILLSGASCEADHLEKLTEEIAKGVPNYYGEQRFGTKGLNHLAGMAILKGEKQMKHHLTKLMLSSVQSKLFNDYLQKRIEKIGLFAELEGEITIRGEKTGPMFGKKMIVPTDAALELENEVLESNELTRDQLQGKFLEGARRDLIVTPQDLSTKIIETGVYLSFFLKKGSYATVVAREFSKG